MLVLPSRRVDLSREARQRYHSRSYLIYVPPQRQHRARHCPNKADHLSGAIAASSQSFSNMLDSRRKVISESIRIIPDFPKKGIMFQDVTTLLLNPEAFQFCIDDFAERYKGQDIEAVVGFEARGFIFGAPLALALHVPFIPLRKPGKLPGETIMAEYQLEYGSDKIEMHKGAIKEGQRVVLLDDLIATGGTLAAGIELMRKVNAVIVECACVIELPDLKGVAKLKDVPLYIQVQKEGD